MSSKTRLLAFGQIAFDVLQTVINELLAADHDRASACVSMAVSDLGYGNYYQMTRAEENNFPGGGRTSVGVG